MTGAAASPALERGETTSTDPRRRVLDAARPHLPLAAAVGAAAIAVSSTGSMVVAAVLLGIAVGDHRSGAALVGAVAAVSVRFSTASFDDVAGIQSVLGPAGVVGPATGAASAWLAAAAVVLAVGRPRRTARSERAGRLASAFAAGALAAAIVAGPGPGGALGVRVAATVLATIATFAFQEAERWRIVRLVGPWPAVAVAAAAVVLAAWP